MSVGWSVPPVFEERREVDIKIQGCFLVFIFLFRNFQFVITASILVLLSGQKQSLKYKYLNITFIYFLAKRT